MIIKRIVAISLISTLSIMLVLLLAGLFIPTKTLEKLSRGSSPDATVVAVDKNGNKIEGATVKVQADGTTVVVDQSGNAIAGASAAASTSTTTTTSTGTGGSTGGNGDTGGTTTPPATGGGSTGGGTTPPPTGGGGTTTPAPTVNSFTASSTSIAYNASTTLNWSSSNATGCTLSTGAVVAASGSTSTGNLTSSKTYTITCTGGGGSASKSVSITVAAAPVSSCGTQGATCTLADIQSHNTAANCWSGIKSGTAGQPTMGTYKITATFINTTHASQKSATTVVNRLCGKAYTSNLRNFTGSHSNQNTKLSNTSYDAWMANFYMGPYN